MNKNNAKDYLPIIQALAEGKTIQVNIGVCAENGCVDKWIDVMSELSFTEKPSQYRIKPEPRVIWVLQTCGGSLDFFRGAPEPDERMRAHGWIKFVEVIDS